MKKHLSAGKKVMMVSSNRNEAHSECVRKQIKFINTKKRQDVKSAQRHCGTDRLLHRYMQYFDQIIYHKKCRARTYTWTSMIR